MKTLLLKRGTIIQLERPNYISDSLSSGIPLVSIPNINQVIVGCFIHFYLKVHFLFFLFYFSCQSIIIEADLVKIWIL